MTPEKAKPGFVVKPGFFLLTRRDAEGPQLYGSQPTD